MSSLRAEGVRFVAVGAFITVLYVSVTTVMRVVFDAPWWLAIAVGYVIATSTHFVLHRKVTFAKDEFQLTTAQQAWRFIQQQAMNRRLKVHQVAQMIIDGELGPPA